MFNRLVSSINQKTETLSPQAEEALVTRFLSGDKEAGTEIVSAHFRLALILSLEYVKKGGSLEELFQEGVLGLYKALERYEPGKGTRFGSYATWWVRSQLQDFMRSNSRQITLPSHIIDQISKLTKVSNTFMTENQREATDAELAELMHLSERKITKLKTHTLTQVSMDSTFPEAEGEDATHHNIIADVHQEAADEYAMRLNDIEELQKNIQAKLSDQEKGVLAHRFGLYGGDELTLEATGALLGVSIARVQQIERAAITKLQKVMIRR